MYNWNNILELIQELVGQKSTLIENVRSQKVDIFKNGGIGLSQLNELLLLLGFRRTSKELFQYLVNGTVEYDSKATIKSIDKLKVGIDRFIKFACLIYGNVNFAFMDSSDDPEEFKGWITETLKPKDESDFRNRKKPILPIHTIEPQNTYYLGHIIENEIKKRLKENPEDIEAKEQEKKRNEIIDIGRKNYEAYLTSDHLDVYVATSMRKRHEFMLVNIFTKEIFNNPEIEHLNLRYFDPTQCYCKNRIDKGLSEVLMLKRAKCTVYLVQESDTFGKDSELATTLAQGKPVIAYVPQGDKKYVDSLIENLQRIYVDKTEQELIFEQLKEFNPKLAWDDYKINQWLSDPNKVNLDELKRKFYLVVEEHYKARADLLINQHPLGIQVNLDTGVANGVLVVRSIDEVAKLIKMIVTNKMDFYLVTEKTEKGTYYLLKDKLSNSIFRVITDDVLLTNTFWNLYFEEESFNN